MAREQSAVKMRLLSGDTLCIKESSMSRSYRVKGSLVQPDAIHFEGDTFIDIDRNGSTFIDIFRQTASCRPGMLVM
jgi:uncharacterized protein YuzE